MVSSQKGKQDPRPQPENLISLIMAAQLSGLSTSHLRLLVRQNEIRGVKLGRDWFTTEQAVREYLSRNVKPGPKPSQKKET
jgi:excisionase family DNA binding protein